MEEYCICINIWYVYIAIAFWIGLIIGAMWKFADPGIKVSNRPTTPEPKD